ncbi:MAG: hypothetical protein WA751_10735 [Candidatus Dormiibacterota bacterium]
MGKWMAVPASVGWQLGALALLARAGGSLFAGAICLSRDRACPGTAA